MEATIILPRHAVHNETTDALAAYIRDQAQLATRCAACGALGVVIREGRLLCAKCGVSEKVWKA